MLRLIKLKIQAKKSLYRITDFLLGQETNEHYVTHVQS